MNNSPTSDTLGINLMTVPRATTHVLGLLLILSLSSCTNKDEVAYRSTPAIDDQTASETEGAVVQVPVSKITMLYSWPMDEPTEYMCCTEAPPPGIAPIFETRSAPKNLEAKIPSTSEGAASTSKEFIATRTKSFCVRTDTIDPTKLSQIQNLPSFYSSCRTFVTYEHFACTCENSCRNRATWTCNCPGVAPGQLPLSAPEDFPQDSLRSKPEFKARQCEVCGGGSTC